MDDDVRKTDEATDSVLDLRFLRCPLPALRTERHLRGMRTGETVTVLADDPLAKLDIAHLCASGGHRLIGTCDEDGFARFRIACGQNPSES